VLCTRRVDGLGSWFSPVAILPVQPVATRPVVSVPERHAA